MFEDNLKIISSCPVCQARYNPIEAKIIAEKNDTHLVYVKCRSCSSAVLAVLFASSIGMSSVGVVTDLTSDDVMKFINVKPVSSDDVIALHKLIRSRASVIDYL